MAKTYKQNCKQCGEYYEGYGIYFCSWMCNGQFNKGGKISFKNPQERSKKISIALQGNQNCLGKKNALGTKRTDEQRKKKSIVAKKIIHTKEWNDNVSKSRKGIKFTEEHKKNISKAKSKDAIYLNCEMCKKKYRIRPSAKIYHNPKYCSRKCYGLANSGEKSTWWNGGSSTFRQKLSNTEQYKNWRKENFERDNYTCQECKERGGRLHVHHHIIPFAKILNSLKEWCDEFNLDLYESALKFEPLWDTNNGQTLCIKCHKKTDTYLRRGL